MRITLTSFTKIFLFISSFLSDCSEGLNTEHSSTHYRGGWMSEIEPVSDNTRSSRGPEASNITVNDEPKKIQKSEGSRKSSGRGGVFVWTNLLFCCMSFLGFVVIKMSGNES